MKDNKNIKKLTVEEINNNTIEYRASTELFKRIETAIINRNRMSQERLDEIIENNKQLVIKNMQEYNNRKIIKEMINDIKQEEIVIQDEFYSELSNILTQKNN